MLGTITERRRSTAASYVLATYIYTLLITWVSGMPANPIPYTEQQSNGQNVTIMIVGDEHFSYYVEPSRPEFAIVRGLSMGTTDYVFAVPDSAYLSLQPSPFRVGTVNPASLMLPPNAGPMVAANVMATQSQFEIPDTNGVTGGGAPFLPGGAPFLPGLGVRRHVTNPTHGRFRRAPVSGTRRNLVLLMRWGDHKTRQLPPPADYTVMFNKVGGDRKLAPSGSVRDFWLKNSFNKLTIDSVVTPWIQVDSTEAWVTDDNDSGRSKANYAKISDAVVQALNKLRTYSNLNGDPAGPVRTWKDSDLDLDGKVDVFTVIHSGYAAEAGGKDANSVPSERRVWSRRFQIITSDKKGGWNSTAYAGNPNGLRFYDLSIENGLAGTTGGGISKIGVVTHEMGHFFNIWDLYADPSLGGGMGKFSLMAKSWGWDGTQERPPSLDGYSKYALGFVQAKDITPGVQTLRAAEDYADLHRIKLNADGTEYLLIENRQPVGWDVNMTMMLGKDRKTGGLLILHIDEKEAPRVDNTNKSGGFPGARNWPQNSVHYPVAILAADGQFHSEKPTTANELDEGEGDDLWRKTSGVAGLSAYTTPNTNAYQFGVEVQTFVTIDQVSDTATTMTYRYSIGRPQGKCAGDPCNGAKKGGVCYFPTPGVDTPACRCNPGWSGANCQIQDKCIVNGGTRCGPNAQCTNDPTQREGFRCTCLNGSFGPKCMATDCSANGQKCTQFRGYLEGTQTVNLILAVPNAQNTYEHVKDSAPGFKMNFYTWGGSQWGAAQVPDYGPGIRYTLSGSSRIKLTVKANGVTGFFSVKVSTSSTANPCSTFNPCASDNSNGVCLQRGAVGVCQTCKPAYTGFSCEQLSNPSGPTCAAPAGANYGSVSCGASTPIGGTCTVACALGYTPASTRLTCVASGSAARWNVAAPTCTTTLRCSAVSSTCPTASPGATCQYSCPGTSKTVPLRCAVNSSGTAGQWTFVNGSC